MEQIIKQKKGKNKVVFISILLIGALFFIGGFSSYNKQEVEKDWKDVNEISEYSYIDAQYLSGPFVEKTLDNGIKKEYYLAINEGRIVGCVLIKQNSTTEIPMVNSDEDYDTAILQSPKRMYGYSKKIESDATKIFAEQINKILETNEVNSTNLSKYIGEFYLDTTASNEDKSLGSALMILGAIMILYFPISLLKNNKDYKKIKKEVLNLKQEGKYDEYENDIKSSNSYKENKYLTIVANENIYNFEKNVLVIPIQKIVNVYKCSIENGQISKNDYICIETNENETYGIAYKPRGLKDYKFDNLINQIKQRMVR